MTLGAHSKDDLRQMQSLPLEAKIRMTKERIEAWYQSWKRFEIVDTVSGKTRYATIDTRDYLADPDMKPTEYIKSVFPGSVYVSFSGGKDSTVLKHIVDSMYADVPAVFVNTGLEYPEIQRFVRDIKAGKYDCFSSDIEIIRPEMRFDEVIRKYGYPVVSKIVSKRVSEARRAKSVGKNDAVCVQQIEGRYKTPDGRPSPYNYKKWNFLVDSPFLISHKCCDIMKKKPIKQYEKLTGRNPITGTMACESRLRLDSWIRNGCNSFESKNPISNPISFWTEQDVLHYIKKFNVPYAPIYGDIQIKQGADQEEGQINLIDFLGCYEPEDILETTNLKRTGCMFCMFGCHLEKEPNRFQRMKKTHPVQYKYCMEKLGLKEVLDYIGVPYE